MIKVSTTGMAVSLKTDLRFPISGQWGHGDRIIHTLVTILIFSGSAPTKFVFKNKGFGTFFQCLPDLPLCLVAFIHIFPFFSTKKDQVNFSTQSVNNNNI